MTWQYLGTPADPKTRVCDWCGAKASKSFELYAGPRRTVGTAQYVYACTKHLDVASRMTSARNGK